MLNLDQNLRTFGYNLCETATRDQGRDRGKRGLSPLCQKARALESPNMPNEMIFCTGLYGEPPVSSENAEPQQPCILKCLVDIDTNKHFQVKHFICRFDLSCSLIQFTYHLIVVNVLASCNAFHPFVYLKMKLGKRSLLSIIFPC